MNRTVLKSLSFLGAAIREGQPHGGVKYGPDEIRTSGLFETLKKIHKIEQITDYGNISIQQLPPCQQSLPQIPHLVSNLHILNPLLQLLNKKLRQLHSIKKQGNIILTVGGDHSIGSSTINAALILWIDAHPDFVDPYAKNTPNQNYHGMPVSHVTGMVRLPGFDWMNEKLGFRDLVMIGIRDIEENQYVSIRKHQVKAFTMDHVLKYGIGDVMTQAIQYLDPTGQCPFHISFDVDAIDPYLASQTGTLFRNGLSHAQACHIIRRVVNERRLVSMDVVQVNPQKGDSRIRPKFRDEEYLREGLTESTGTAVDLITSLCSKTLTI